MNTPQKLLMLPKEELVRLILDLQEEVRLLKEELARAKKISPKPEIKPSTLEKDKEKKTNSNKGKVKASKNLLPDETIVLYVKNLPENSVFKGYEDYFVQRLIIQKVVTLYRRAKYLLPDGTYKIADLPAGTNGHFDNTIKKYIVHESYENNVSQAKIRKSLIAYGIKISEGEVHNIIMETAELLNKEYEDVGKAGITQSKEIRVDDSGHRHKGKNGFVLALQNDFFTYYKTSDSKSRNRFLMALRCASTEYVLNDVALSYIDRYQPKASLKAKYIKLSDVLFSDKASWDEGLKSIGITNQNTGAELLRVIEEAAILGGAIKNGLKPETILLSDGAQQYNMLVHAACWIHAERTIKAILPLSDPEAKEVEKIREQIWDFYKVLQAYKLTPTIGAKASISKQFDAVFGQSVISIKLAAALKSFRDKKDDLLRVLDFPFIPLHNNSSENDIRSRVIKNNVSGGTRSDKGLRARDICGTLSKTCTKNKIYFWDYLGDRFDGTNNIPNLADIITRRAQHMSASSP